APTPTAKSSAAIPAHAGGPRAMSNQATALDVVRAYHQAWSSGRYDEAGQRLSDKLEIEVPINSYPTKASFLEAVARTKEMPSKLELLAELGARVKPFSSTT